MDAALLSLAEIFEIHSRNQYVMNIYGSSIVRITQLATTRNHDLHYRVASSPLIHQRYKAI